MMVNVIVNSGISVRVANSGAGGITFSKTKMNGGQTILQSRWPSWRLAIYSIAWREGVLIQSLENTQWHS
jgi:hypothetical protein